MKQNSGMALRKRRGLFILSDGPDGHDENPMFDKFARSKFKQGWLLRPGPHCVPVGTLKLRVIFTRKNG